MQHPHAALPRFDARAILLLAVCRGVSCARPLEGGQSSESAKPDRQGAMQTFGKAAKATDSETLTELEVQPMGQMRRAAVHAHTSRHHKAALVDLREARHHKIEGGHHNNHRNKTGEVNQSFSTEINYLNELVEEEHSGDVHSNSPLHEVCDIHGKMKAGTDPKEVLDWLHACTKALGDFALKTKQGNKASKEANEAYMHEYSAILRLLSKMKDVKSMTDAFNKDHLNAVNYLLRMAGTIEADIGNLLPAGRTMLPTNATIMPPQPLSETMSTSLPTVDQRLEVEEEEQYNTTTSLSMMDQNSQTESQTSEVNRSDEQEDFGQNLSQDKDVLPSSITSKPLNCMMDDGKAIMVTMRKPNDPENTDNSAWVCDVYFPNNTQESVEGKYLGTFSFSDVQQHNIQEDEISYEGEHLTMNIHSEEIKFLELMTSVSFLAEKVDNTFMGIIWEDHVKGIEHLCEALDSSLQDGEDENFDDSFIPK